MAKWVFKTFSGLVERKIIPIEGVIVVGRESSCGLHIKKNEISRKHAEIEDKDGELTLTDSGSANGTTVNGQKVAGSIVLKVGDKVLFEEVEFIVETEAAIVAASDESGGGGSATAIMGVVGDSGHEETQMQLSVGTTFISVVRGSDPIKINLDNMHALKIGRANDCDLVLSDAAVSGSHAQMSLESDGWQISNISSTNGLFVKGNKVVKATLKDGDTIELGGVVLQFSSDESSGGGGGERKIPDWMRNQE